jgi:hypothetical protein
MVETVKLIPNPRNPNKHPDKQLQLLAKIIAVQGWRNPITVSNLSGFIVRGHGRLLAAQVLELEQCPVDYQDYANEAEEWADLIADNRLAELAEMNFSVLADVLLELDTANFDMALTGFEPGELKNIMAWTPEGKAFEASEQKEPERKADCFVEIYCTLLALTEMEATLSEWSGHEGVTVNIQR